jgi:hypothetical protein
MSQTIADAIWEEGSLIGKSEGKTEGALEVLRRTLRQLLEDRLGSVPPVVLNQIENSTDIERLNAAVRQVLHVVKPQDLTL